MSYKYHHQTGGVHKIQHAFYREEGKQAQECPLPASHLRQISPHSLSLVYRHPADPAT